MSKLEPTETGERGAIVNMASVAAFDGQIGQAAYSASKGGIVGLTLPVARDLSCVRDPAQHDRARPGRHPDLRRGPGRRGVQGQAPARACSSRSRLGVPDELASMVRRAASGTTYMNGETIRVDGGIRMPPK